MAANLVQSFHGVHHHHQCCCFSFNRRPTTISLTTSYLNHSVKLSHKFSVKKTHRRTCTFTTINASLDLTEDNVKQVLDDARTTKFSHLFDTSVGMTGVAELAEVDGPFVKIRLKGRFWHERSLILARLGNYLKERIPILEVDIEDEKQLDDSPENF
ncbi:uncharacterized protein [Rutidosis leptorrhynchoides]|uniref:uncharacterized protein isoform X2 n=1 Tax=Rutidosis leptorrhynchoides TaxID=125765 RepID=UPI003A99F616